MAEQFLRAWRINIDDLYAIVGKKDDRLLKEIKAYDNLTEELDNLIKEVEDYSLENALRDIIDGTLNKKCAYSYLRTLELILTLNGELYDSEVVLPGRGWQNIGPSFLKWKLPTLHKLWTKKQLVFPWKPEDKVSFPDWPIAMILESEAIQLLKKELENFDRKLLDLYPLPERLEGLEIETEYMIETMLQWLNTPNKDLILVLDGQQ